MKTNLFFTLFILAIVGSLMIPSAESTVIRSLVTIGRGLIGGVGGGSREIRRQSSIIGRFYPRYNQNDQQTNGIRWFFQRGILGRFFG
ncbi:hypothetical protein DERF_011612 [Dermatophagoides farinae]|uniref:Uncharacterized protein n=1 Tax=Dermatophagoides farinae TaxID=6954 RepID=A0A922HSI3_DERFA|nr:hypothetical protein DERF_011612 [Dermatophagoides farinae]